MDEVLTVRKGADFFRIHPTTVLRMVKRGELPGFRVRSDWHARFNSGLVGVSNAKSFI
jgi:hypothetical protein